MYDCYNDFSRKIMFLLKPHLMQQTQEELIQIDTESFLTFLILYESQIKGLIEGSMAFLAMYSGELIF